MSANAREKSRAAALEKLAELRRQATANLPSRVLDLERTMSGARRDPELLMRARVVAHQLLGSAAILGFPEVGRIAGQIEADVLQLLAPHSTGKEADWAALDGRMQQLQRAFQRESAEVEART